MSDRDGLGIATHNNGSQTYEKHERIMLIHLDSVISLRLMESCHVFNQPNFPARMRKLVHLQTKTENLERQPHASDERFQEYQEQQKAQTDELMKQLAHFQSLFKNFSEVFGNSGAGISHSLGIN